MLPLLILTMLKFYANYASWKVVSFKFSLSKMKIKMILSIRYSEEKKRHLHKQLKSNLKQLSVKALRLIPGVVVIMENLVYQRKSRT